MSEHRFLKSHVNILKEIPCTCQVQIDLYRSTIYTAATFQKKYADRFGINLTKVRPLFTLSHRGSDNSLLLIVFSANNIDQSIGYFYATESRLNDFVIFKNNALCLSTQSDWWKS